MDFKINEKEQFKKNLNELIKLINQNIKSKSIILNDQERIKYIRGDNLFDYLNSNCKKLLKIKKFFEIGEKGNFENFLDFLLKNKILIKLNRKQNEVKKLKFPKELEIDTSENFEVKKFYFFTISPPSNYFFPVLILGIIFLVCLFPIWPISFRIFVFYLSLYLLIFLLGLSLVRLFIYMFLRIFGIEFWILPDFYSDDRFFPIFPLYSFEMVKDKMLGYILRISFIIVFLFLVYFQLYHSKTVEEIKNISKDSYNDIVVWGLDKISFNITYHKDNMISQEEIENL